MGSRQVQDDLLTYDLLDSRNDGDNGPRHPRSFLESENYERELGAPSSTTANEDFSDIIKHEIVEVIGDGDLAGRPIVMIYAYRLPPSKGFDHEKLFRFLQHTLDRVVDMDYTILYFHYGLKSGNKPSIKWLIQAYKLLDRRYKKNLKALYLVHPSKFIKILWGIFKPFISYKFERKMHYCNFIDELNVVVRIERLRIPKPISDHDQSVKNSMKSIPSSNQRTLPPSPTHQFGVSLDFILENNPGSEIPPIVEELIVFLSQYGMEIEGIFRRSPELAAINRLKERINSGEKIDFLKDPEYIGDIPKAVINASGLLKTFLRSIEEPLFTNRLYPRVVEISELNEIDRVSAIRELVETLPKSNYDLLRVIIEFLTQVSSHSAKNLMNPNNLSIVFGPNLTWPTDQQVSPLHINNLNSFCHTLIVHYEEIFCQKPR